MYRISGLAVFVLALCGCNPFGKPAEQTRAKVRAEALNDKAKVKVKIADLDYQMKHWREMGEKVKTVKQ